jgi:glycosyltransferase involved in cell wall biosynthesis
MLIGINSAAAFKQPRTGVEEYAYHLIKHLAMLKESGRHRFLLYCSNANDVNYTRILPENFEIKQLKWPWPMWTQARLAGELFLRQPDALLIPVHVLPLTHPKNSVVTIHGLEYEYYPEMYPPRHLRYLRWSTKYALKHARRIVAVSENTKKDLIELYGGNPEKIEVVYHGINQSQISKLKTQNHSSNLKSIQPYILFIGRLEIKKNIHGLIQGFNLLKEKYRIPHKLVLVGPKGYGYESFKFQVSSFKFKNDIIETGYVSEQEKWALLKNADVFILPSFYEGFGMPILEAQAVGIPVVASNVSSMPEVAGEGAILIDPKNIKSIARGIYKIISDENLKKKLVKKGYENVKRFSWQKCARDMLKILTE